MSKALKTTLGRPPSTTREEIAAVALALFAERGFEATTVDEIAAAVGVGRRTLFRYFGSKNDIAWGDFDWVMERLRDALAAGDGLPLMEALRDGVVESNRYPDEQLPGLRIRMTLITRTPALQAHSALRYAEWRARRRRVGGGAPRPRARRPAAAGDRLRRAGDGDGDLRSLGRGARRAISRRCSTSPSTRLPRASRPPTTAMSGAGGFELDASVRRTRRRPTPRRRDAAAAGAAERGGSRGARLAPRRGRPRRGRRTEGDRGWRAGTKDDRGGGLAGRLERQGLLHPLPGDGAGEAEVTAVIPALDGGERLVALVRLLVEEGPVIVVDDGSRDGSGARAAAAGARVIRHDAPRGPAAARNAGLHAADTELVAFLDADCIVAAEWRRGLATLLAADPELALVAPRVRSARGGSALARYEEAASPLDLGPHGGLVGPDRRTAYVPAAALVARRDALLALGGFDESLRFGEDVDLVWRLLAAGHEVRYVTVPRGPPRAPSHTRRDAATAGGLRRVRPRPGPPPRPPPPPRSASVHTRSRSGPPRSRGAFVL